jgi:hypothetical protein
MTEPREAAADAFVLGMNVEEVYMTFAEGFQALGGGLGPEQYDLVERKARQVRDALLDFGAPHDLVQRFEDAAANLHRKGDPLPRGLDGLAESSSGTGRVISGLMSEMRTHLGHDDARLYDLGVMLARLHLCLRVVAPDAGSAPPEMYEIYSKELLRVASVTHHMLTEDELGRALQLKMSGEVVELVERLAEALAAWDGGSDAWCRATRKRLDRIFGAAGTVLRSVVSAAGDDERRQILENALDQYRAQGWRVVRRDDFEATVERGRGVRHPLHFVLTLLTFGMWAFVWIALTVRSRSERGVVYVNAYGNVLTE